MLGSISCNTKSKSLSRFNSLSVRFAVARPVEASMSNVKAQGYDRIIHVERSGLSQREYLRNMLPVDMFVRVIVSLNLLFTGILLFSCSSTKIVIKDAMQIRQVLGDDPLAVKLPSIVGEKISVGDVILTERSIDRVQTKTVHESRYDLLLTVRGVEELRWKAFARKRGVSEAAFVLQGVVRRIFPVVRPDTNLVTIIAIDSVASSETELQRIVGAIRKSAD